MKRFHRLHRDGRAASAQRHPNTYPLGGWCTACYMHVPMLGTRRVVVRHSCNANARRIQQANINHDEDRVPRCPECALAPYDPDEEMMCRSCAEHWSVVAEIDDARDRTRPDPSDAYKIARGG